MEHTTFYFVRHGETEYNRRRIMQGRRIDCALNDTGRRQAAALARRLADVPFDAIYSSDLRRAVETAEKIAEHHPDVPRFQTADLDEMSWGVYEGLPSGDRVQSMLDDMYARWSRGEFGHRVEEGESIRDVQERAVRAVSQMVERHPGGTILAVTHGRLLRVLLASILDGGLERMDAFDHANTCVNLITYGSGAFDSSLLNCTAHLDAVDSVLVE